jgi:chromosomal replication initiation ATPase DnaA
MTLTEYQSAVQHFEQAIRKYTKDYHIPEAIPQLYRGYIVEVFGFDPAEPKRSNDRMSEAKHCYRALLRFNLNLSTQEIADLSGGINHTSVCYSVKAHYNLMLTDRVYNAKVMEVQSKIDKYNKN